MADDTKTGTDGRDILDGGSGDDNLDGGGGIDALFGGSGDDTLTGGGAVDFLLGGDGADTIYGGEGGDWIRGGSGADTIYGGEGGDTILGDDGNDTIYGGEGDDTIIDGGGDDTLTGGTGEDTFGFLPGHGNDTITDFDTANDQIDLSQFTMAITWAQLSAKITTVTDPDDVNVVTGVQIDLSEFGGGTITLEGITATSTLTAEMFCLPECDSPLDELLVESPVTGDEYGNFYLGDARGGTYTTLGGADNVFAEEGDDTIYGGAGDDWLVGGEGADTIEGGADADWIDGGEGNDILKGDAGEDKIDGGEGDDTITGGAGADRFVFNSGDGNDTITDFENGTDTIDLSAITAITGFSDLTITQVGDDTRIDLGGDVGVITLEDFTANDLDATDFDFSM